MALFFSKWNVCMCVFNFWSLPLSYTCLCPACVAQPRGYIIAVPREERMLEKGRDHHRLCAARLSCGRTLAYLGAAAPSGGHCVGYREQVFKEHWWLADVSHSADCLMLLLVQKAFWGPQWDVHQGLKRPNQMEAARRRLSPDPKNGKNGKFQ